MSDHVTQESVALSEQGAARREAMLGELLTFQGHVKRRRRVRRIGGVALVPVFVIVAAFAASNFGAGGPVEESIVAEETKGASNTPPRFQWAQMVTAGSTPLDRYTVEPPSLVERIDDRELLRVLEEMGRPAGLIRIAGQTRLTAAVVDDEMPQ